MVFLSPDDPTREIRQNPLLEICRTIPTQTQPGIEPQCALVDDPSHAPECVEEDGIRRLRSNTLLGQQLLAQDSGRKPGQISPLLLRAPPRAQRTNPPCLLAMAAGRAEPGFEPVRGYGQKKLRVTPGLTLKPCKGFFDCGPARVLHQNRTQDHFEGTRRRPPAHWVAKTVQQAAVNLLDTMGMN